LQSCGRGEPAEREGATKSESSTIPLRDRAMPGAVCLEQTALALAAAIGLVLPVR